MTAIALSFVKNPVTLTPGVYFKICQFYFLKSDNIAYFGVLELIPFKYKLFAVSFLAF